MPPLPPMKSRYPSTPLRHPLRCAALLLVLALAACSSLAAPGDTATTALSADYRSMIAKRMKLVFKDLINDSTEISDPRWAQSNKGWAWMVCVRFQDRGHRRAYVLFFDRSLFVDERYAVQTDNCDTQTYSPLDSGPGIKPGALGDTGPLY
jgi:hypothetical protein